MKYMLMLYGNEDVYAGYDEDQLAQDLKRYEAFEALLDERGIVHSSQALRPSEAATTLRVRSGSDEIVVTDGPFAEGKEQVGGFYIIEAADLDEALAVARHCPNDLAVEVRPVWEFDG